MRRFALILIALIGCLIHPAVRAIPSTESAASAMSATPVTPVTRADCDSCRFTVTSLDKPISLAGMWLFTRDDNPQNKDVNVDTSNWKTIKAPGPWKKAYSDGKNFTVGWHRGTFDFAPELIGKEVVFLLDAHMSRVSFYIDGVEAFHRPSTTRVEPYYSLQPIPVRFKVTQPQHVVAFRIETYFMTGVYQMPFELRPYVAQDPGLAWYYFRGGELRVFAAAIVLVFGLFFLLVYAKTSYSLYLVSALNSLIVFPFFVAPADFLLRSLSPEPLYFLHYVGLLVCYPSYLFSQYFYKFTPRINKVYGAVATLLGLLFLSFMVQPNLDLFQKIRVLTFLIAFISGAVSVYFAARGIQQRRPGAGVLFVGTALLEIAAVHDMLLGFGLINSTSMLFTGIMMMTIAMLYVAINIFANTFRENSKLLKTTTALNDRLEDLVAERTAELGTANKELSTANVDLRQAFERLHLTQDELVRSEKLAALGSLVAGIAHELNTPIGNGLMAISTLRDEQKSFQQDVAEKGLRRSTFDAFLAMVARATDIAERSLGRSAELVTSFKQLAVDQTTSNRRRFYLTEILKEVLVILHPTLKRTPYKISTSVADDLEMDSIPGALGQTLTNLINNAVIHGFDGRDHGIIHISAEPGEPGYLIIKVKDDGKGIAAKDLPKIYDPFFTTKLGQGGSGLGLHISHTAVTQLLGGTMHVSSQPGQGTEFTLTLPAAAPATTVSLLNKSE